MIGVVVCAGLFLLVLIGLLVFQIHALRLRVEKLESREDMGNA